MFATLKAAYTSDYERVPIGSWDNLTFDGSSIRGFTAQHEATCASHGLERILLGAADYFGAGKVLIFGEVIDKDDRLQRGHTRSPQTIRQRSLRKEQLHPQQRP